jgi:peptidoglycan/xylan/chitin deacetylase (PgdA/CDA1 family)
MATVVDTDRPRDLIGYGRRPPKVKWPNGAKVAVNLVINYEEGSEHYERLGDRKTDGLAELNWALPKEFRDYAMEAVYEYGSRAGVWRLLNMFQEYGIHMTFFACGMALQKNPEVGAAIREFGHEPCSHGYRWSEPWHFKSREEEKEQIDLAIQAIRETTGSRPVGWYWRYSSTPWTRDLLVEDGGFLYDSETYNDDLPYFTEVLGKRHLVVPYSQTYNDVKFIMAEGAIGSPGQFADLLKRGVDELHREGERGYPKMMSVGLHSRWTGQPARANALREFIEHCLDKGDVWFARRDEIAQWWIDHSDEWER